VAEAVTIVDFEPRHLDGILRLSTAEGWPSFAADPARALRVLTAPGVRTLVAERAGNGEVVGFARALGDGELTAYLAELAVVPELRGQGIGVRLVEVTLARCGAIRLDLLAEPESEGFYRRLPHREKPGFRVYPKVRPHP